MIEFLVVFPVVLVLILGVLEFTFLSLVHQNVNYAAFNAARAEIVDKDPHRSAWMSLFAMTSHTIQNMSPWQALEYSQPDLADELGGREQESNLCRMITGSECLADIVHVFQTSGFIPGVDDAIDTSSDMSVLDGLLGLLYKPVKDFLSGADPETPPDSGDSTWSYPPLVRKAIYAAALVDVKTKKLKDPQAPAVKVTVTYYYPLKFPVIRNLIRWTLRSLADPSPSIPLPFSGTGSRWSKADRLSEMSGARFIPVSHHSILGDERAVGTPEPLL